MELVLSWGWHPVLGPDVCPQLLGLIISCLLSSWVGTEEPRLGEKWGPVQFSPHLLRACYTQCWRAMGWGGESQGPRQLGPPHLPCYPCGQPEPAEPPFLFPLSALHTVFYSDLPRPCCCSEQASHPDFSLLQLRKSYPSQGTS